MLPHHRVPSDPGEILKQEFLRPPNLSQSAFAAHLGVPAGRIHDLVRGRRGVAAEDAWLFAQALGTTPEFPLSLQMAHDLAAARGVRRVPKLRMAG